MKLPANRSVDSNLSKVIERAFADAGIDREDVANALTMLLHDFNTDIDDDDFEIEELMRD